MSVILTEGILKSVDSAVEVISRGQGLLKRQLNIVVYIVKYKGNLVELSGKTQHSTKKAAERAIKNFVLHMFKHGDYWQNCSDNIKKWNGYEVDFSETIKLISPYGTTDKWEKPETQKIIKDITAALIKEGLFTIHPLEIK